MILALIYLIPMCFIFMYAIVQLSLVIAQGKYNEPNTPEPAAPLPKVCVQLPIYNERYVVERLLKAIDGLNYPKELLEVQILDDSTDDTSEIISQCLLKLGPHFKHIRRAERKGFKAGALDYGLGLTDATIISIFDADFVPSQDFLLRTVPHFSGSEIGVVQSRWGHLNENKSMLTRLQAFGLNAHFFIEQTGRYSGGHFINFNGTAGVWRKETIETAGGWKADTLTEDLDLSYRAQMLGWKFIYLDSLDSPAELPEQMPAIRSQQYRWMKGGAECLLKNTGKLWRSSATLGQKLHGTFHLLNSSVFLFVLLVSIVSLFITFWPGLIVEYRSLLGITVLFQVNWLILGMFYWLAFKRQNKSFYLFVKRFLLFLVYMMGLSLHNALAVLEAYVGRKTPFVRTPKKGDTDGKGYDGTKVHPLSYVEVLFAGFFLLAFIFNLYYGRWGMLPFHGMSFIGYALVVFYTFKHSYA